MIFPNVIELHFNIVYALFMLHIWHGMDYMYLRTKKDSRLILILQFEIISNTSSPAQTNSPPHFSSKQFQKSFKKQQLTYQEGWMILLSHPSQTQSQAKPSQANGRAKHM